MSIRFNYLFKYQEPSSNSSFLNLKINNPPPKINLSPSKEIYESVFREEI